MNIEAKKEELKERDLLCLVCKCAKLYNVTVDEILGRRRLHRICHARHVIWATLYNRGHWSLPQLGLLFERDHTTILNGVNRISGEEIDAIDPPPPDSQPAVLAS
ncbi:MAG: helix-turn-helix domain-containing protein [Patescibacteria group bacterium]